MSLQMSLSSSLCLLRLLRFYSIFTNPFALNTKIPSFSILGSGVQCAAHYLTTESQALFILSTAVPVSNSRGDWQGELCSRDLFSSSF